MISQIANNDQRPIFKDALKKAMQQKTPEPPRFTISDIPQRISYKCDQDVITTNVHFGQRKLFLTELEFILNRVNLSEPSWIIYAGAAPGIHIRMLADMFPSISWILIDPSTFEITGKTFMIPESICDERGNTSKKLLTTVKPGCINLIQALMSNSLASVLKNLKQTYYFISDIRTVVYHPENAILRVKQGAKNLNIGTETFGSIPSNLDVLWNSAQQLNWIKILGPKLYMIKFRVPYMDKKNFDITKNFFKQNKVPDFIKTDFEISAGHGINFKEDYLAKKFSYLQGTLYLQCFAGRISSETRLVGGFPLKIIQYNVNEYDDTFYYFNRVDRCFVMHENIFADQELGFDYCNDCSKEAALWVKYLKHIRKPASRENVLFLVRELTRATHSALISNRGGHGSFFAPVSEEYFEKILRCTKKIKDNYVIDGENLAMMF